VLGNNIPDLGSVVICCAALNTHITDASLYRPVFLNERGKQTKVIDLFHLVFRIIRAKGPRENSIIIAVVKGR